MNKQNIHSKYIEEDEIGLRELWATLVRRKMTILSVVSIATLSAAFYVYTAKPIYRGEVLLEVGEVVNNNQVVNNNLVVSSNQPTTIFNLDNINSLKEIVQQNTGLSVEIPKETNNVLRISMESGNIDEIKPKLQNSIDFIFSRHQEKAKLYQNNNAKIRMTQVIGEIQIGNDPIKPKKALIITIGFITGLILGVFVAFFREFISNNQKTEED